MSVRSRSNWNLEVLVFKERGKPEYPEKNLSEQRREPTTNSTHVWRRHLDSNPGHIGGRRVLSPMCHPCSPREFIVKITRPRCRFKVSSRSFNFHRDYSSSLTLSNVSGIFWRWILKRERKFCRGLFTSSIKRETRDFHVVVVQWRKRNLRKSVLPVQSCGSAN